MQRRRQVFRRTMQIVVCLVLLFTAACHFFAPALVRARMRHALQRAGWTVRRLDVDRFTWRRMRLSNIELGPDAEIRVEAVTFAYGADTWRAGVPSRIRISGLRVDLPGLKNLLPALRSTGNWQRMLPLLTRIEQMSIDSSSIILSGSPDRREFPFSASLHSAPGGRARMRLTATGLVEIEGTMQIDEAGRVQVQVGPVIVQKQDPLADLLAEYAGVRAWGRLGVKLAVAEGTAGLAVSLSDAGFEREKISAGQIAGTVILPDVREKRTAGGQRISIGALQVGNFNVTNSHITFTMEDADRVLVEDVVAYWEGGRLSLASFRLQPSAGFCGVTIFCERVGFAEILQALLDERIQGSGRLLGRLPLRVRWKPAMGLSLGSGYLYSEPGGGVLRVEDRTLVEQILAAAGPAGQDNVAVAVRAELVDALQDFKYDSLRIHVKKGIGGRPAGAMRLSGRGRKKDGLPVELTLRFSTDLL